MQEIPVQFLGWEEPLEEGMVTHSSILAWRIPMDKGAWQSTVMTKHTTQAFFTLLNYTQVQFNSVQSLSRV